MRATNDIRPGYKHTSLGWIPKDWNVSKLVKLVEKIGSGITPTGGQKVYKPRGRIFLRSQNVGWGQLLLDEVAFIDENTHNSFASSEIKLKDVLLNITGASIGRSAVANSAVVGGNVNQHVCIIRLTPNGPLIPEYLNYFLVSTKGQNLINSFQAGGNREGLNFEQIKSFVISLPPIPEQQHIVSILTAWDEAITKTKQLVSKLQQRNKSLLQMEMTPKTNWKPFRIGDIIKEVSRPIKWNDDELYHLISVRRRSEGAFYRESLWGRQILTKQLFTVEEDDFLISKMQIVHGASALVPSTLKHMNVSGSYIVINSQNNKKLDIHFLNWLSKTRHFYKMTYVSSYGVHIEKMTFDYDDFKNRKVMLPSSIQEQKRIVQRLELAQEEANLLEQKLTILQLQKKGLIHKLLTGEIRVRI